MEPIFENTGLTVLRDQARLLASAGELWIQEHIRLPKALEQCKTHGLPIILFETSYFLSREIIVPTKGTGMAHWREALFALMSRNSGSVAGFFRSPNNYVVELGTRVQT